jgi:hypothetical protein
MAPTRESVSPSQVDVEAINLSSLEKLAQKLASEGPYKYQSTPRRVRGLLDGQYAFDTVDAYHVWEHSRYPQ